MSVFDSKSRYVLHARQTEAVDRRGRRVACVTPAEPPTEPELGLHRLREGQRLDHLADHYLSDPGAFWRIGQLNDGMTVEAALARALIRIPRRR